jgi:cation diffusion facilitator family transporter
MSSQEDRRSIQLTLAVYILLFLMKLAVYAVSGVMALLAEALHTFSDIIISAFLLIALRYARRHPNERHMVGYGRAQNVAALVAATIFIAVTSFTLYKEAIPRLFEQEAVDYQSLSLVVAVLALCMIIAAAPLIRLARQEKRGAAARAQFIELINDELGLLAALVGTLFIIAGHPIADPIATIVVATIIAVNGAGLFRENASYLLGRTPEPAVMERIQQLALSVPGVLGLHNLRAEGIGPEQIQSTMHVVVSRGMPIEDADVIIEQVDQELHDAFPNSYFVIHADASKPQIEQRDST